MNPTEDDSQQRLDSANSEPRPVATASSSAGPKKRASRAGTRSVSNLSSAQLERKRANDREAQRAIRQRQKDSIETLEREKAELNVQLESRDRDVAAAQVRIRELEQENMYLRSRVGSTDAFLLQLPGTDVKVDPSSTPSMHDSPLVRFPTSEVARTPTESARASLSGPAAAPQQRPEIWRAQSHVGTFPQTDSGGPAPARADPRHAVFRSPPELTTSLQSQPQATQTQLDAQRGYATPAAPDRPAWPSNPNYSYMVEAAGAQQPPAYGAQKQVIGFQSQQPPNQYTIQSSMQQNPQQQPAGFGSTLNTPSAEFATLSMQSPAAHTPSHDQHAAHSPYGVPASHIPTGEPFQAQQPQARTPMAPPTYNQPSTSQAFSHPPGMAQPQHMPLEYQGQQGQQPNYAYPQYHGNG